LNQLGKKKSKTTNPDLLRKKDVSMHQKYVDRKELKREQELQTRARKEGVCKISGYQERKEVGAGGEESAP